MKFCKNCVMPDTRPGIMFNDEGVCFPCVNALEKQSVNWNSRMDELKWVLKGDYEE